MRGVWVATFFALVFIALGAGFAWRTTRVESGWNPDKIIVDNSALRREEEALAEESKSAVPEWMQKMAKPNETPLLSAEESAISWDLVSPEFRTDSWLVLRFDNLDRFQKRCLSAFLKTRQIAHVVDEGDFYDIRLANKDPMAADGLIKELATYDLSATLITLETPKPY
ncbi:MAG: hypothetical protein LBF86_06200 [Helicobacteraceae bacterium]|jgi:hypothetical protein|nr:hypothetical protein [Helicobacteraceae bacterium]